MKKPRRHAGLFAPDIDVFSNQFIEKLRQIGNIGEDFSKY